MLTLLIETYNNTEGLKNVLCRIAEQGADTAKFEIVILDDGSDLDVKELVETVPESLRSITQIKRNPCHIGYPGVLANMFVDTASKWCMPVTDETVFTEGGLKTVLSDLDEFGEDAFGIIEYNTFDIRPDILDEYLFSDSLESFCDNMQSISEYGGAGSDDLQMMLTGLSNKVYNIEVLAPFASYAYRFAGSCIPGYIAGLKALECRNMLHLHHNVRVTAAQTVTSAVNIRDASLGMTLLADLDLKTESDIKNRIIRIFSYNYMTVISDYISGGLSDPEYLSALYERCYKKFLDEQGDKFFAKITELSKTGEDIMYLMELLEQE